MKSIKSKLLIIVALLLTTNLSVAQQWMTDLSIAQKLASVQNKMVFMVWEETTKYPYPVVVLGEKGRTYLISNLFEDEDISPLIWKYFVPVIVSENQYADLFDKIKETYSKTYIDKFNDDSIKIMDVNGNILNISYNPDYYENITTIIRKYGLNTEYIREELVNYRNDTNFYSAYFLASKYLDLALYATEKVRPEIVDLSNIYLNEALAFVPSSVENEKLVLEQRCHLLKIQEHLVLKRPKRVIRQLKRMDAETIDSKNRPLMAFLYYVAYSSTGDIEKAEVWKTEVSLLNLRKAQLLINLNV